MSKLILSEPVARMHGSPEKTTPTNKESKMISRCKYFGKDKHGNPIYGPQEFYAYRLHQGKWSEAATQNRNLFAEAQRQAHAAIKDPATRPDWEARHADHIKHVKQGERLYATLIGFVSATILAEMKKAAE